jgi:hypothetical protein
MRGEDCQLNDAVVASLAAMCKHFEEYNARVKREERQRQGDARVRRLEEIRRETDVIVPHVNQLVDTEFPEPGPLDLMEIKRLQTEATNALSELVELLEAVQTLATSHFMEKLEVAFSEVKRDRDALADAVHAEMQQIGNKRQILEAKAEENLRAEQARRKQEEAALKLQVEQNTQCSHHEDLEREAALELERIALMSRERLKSMAGQHYNQTLQDQLEYQRKATAQRELEEKQWTDQLFSEALPSPKPDEKKEPKMIKMNVLAGETKMKADVKRLKRIQKERAAAKLKQKEADEHNARKARNVLIQRERDIAAAKFHQEKLRQETRLREKKEAEERKVETIQKARDDVDEGDDDTEYEKSERLEARKKLKAYRDAGGSVWACARDNDTRMLKHFFLVIGSRKLLKMHNADKEEGGKTLLHTACWSGSMDVVAYLLEMGIGVDERDTAYSMMTPLMYAARARHSNIVILLIKHGADINLQDRDGCTCLHWASRMGWGSMLVSMLSTYRKIHPTKSKGVLQITNSRGRTCLQGFNHYPLPYQFSSQLWLHRHC